jgi:hypothetical protein
VYQSGYAKEQKIRRYLRDAEKMLSCDGPVLGVDKVLQAVEAMLRGGCYVYGSNRGGVKSMVFSESLKWEAKQ